MSVETLPERIRSWARTRDRIALTSLNADLSIRESVTYSELERLAARVAKGLSHWAAGERVLIMLSDPIAFVSALLACWTSDLIPVCGMPPHKPRRGSSRGQARLSRLDHIMQMTSAQAVIAHQGLVSDLQPHVRDASVLAIQSLRSLEPNNLSIPPGRRAAEGLHPALIQFSSGSTGAPGGVVVTHSNLSANLSAQAERMQVCAEDVVVSWLPLHHDLGLIGATLLPLYAGFPVWVMPAEVLAQSPDRWIRAMSDHRATISWAPNFAYAYCARAVAALDMEGCNLSNWRIAMNAAEPVRADSCKAFADALGNHGFRPEAMAPCYGLAEATLGATGPEPWSGTRSLPSPMQRDPLSLRPSLVSCGTPLSGVDLVIVDPATRTPVSDGVEGEIWLAGPSIAQGYWNEPDKTAEVFGQSLSGESHGRFLRTGDLGYLVGGELYVAGRLKDLIIVQGANVYPDEVEPLCEGSHPVIREGGACVVATAGSDTEGLVVACEVDRGAEAIWPAICQAVRRTIGAELGLDVERIVLTRVGTLPRTSSGKMQRQRCAAALQNDELPLLFDDRLERLKSEPRATSDSSGDVVDWLHDRLGIAPEEGDLLLADLGLTSLQVTELAADLEAQFGQRVPLADLYEMQRLSELITRLRAG